MGRRVSSDERQRIHRKQREGLNVQELAKLFRRSSQTISKALREVRALSAADVARATQLPPVVAVTNDDQALLTTSLPLQTQREHLPTRASRNPRRVPPSAFVDGGAAPFIVPEPLQRAASASVAERYCAPVSVDGAQPAAEPRNPVQTLQTRADDVHSPVRLPIPQPPRTLRSSHKSPTVAPPLLQQDVRELRSRPRQALLDTPATPASAGQDESTRTTPTQQHSPPESDQPAQAPGQRKGDPVTTLPTAVTPASVAASGEVSAPSSTPSTTVVTSACAAPVIRPVVRPPRVLPFVRSAPPVQNPTSSTRSNSNETPKRVNTLSEITSNVATTSAASTSSTRNDKSEASKQQPPRKSPPTPAPESELMELLLGMTPDNDMSPLTSQEDGKAPCYLLNGIEQLASTSHSQSMPGRIEQPE